MSLDNLDNIIRRLRYVKYGDDILSSDHNDLVDAVKTTRDIVSAVGVDVKNLCSAWGVQFSPQFDPTLADLDAIIAKLLYRRFGDIVMPEDHNYLVDAVKVVRDLLAMLISDVEKLKQAVRPLALSIIEPIGIPIAGRPTPSTIEPIGVNVTGTLSYSVQGPITTSISGTTSYSVQGPITTYVSSTASYSVQGPITTSISGTTSYLVELTE